MSLGIFSIYQNLVRVKPCIDYLILIKEPRILQSDISDPWPRDGIYDPCPSVCECLLHAELNSLEVRLPFSLFIVHPLYVPCNSVRVGKNKNLYFVIKESLQIIIHLVSVQLLFNKVHHKHYSQQIGDFQNSSELLLLLTECYFVL